MICTKCFTVDSVATEGDHCHKHPDVRLVDYAAWALGHTQARLRIAQDALSEIESLEPFESGTAREALKKMHAIAPKSDA